MAFLGGALSSLSGLMGDVGVAVPAAQAYEENKQNIEMNKMKLLMEKQQMQSDADFGKAMEDLSNKAQQPGADDSGEARLKSLYNAALKTKNVNVADKIASQLTQLEEHKQTQERLKQQHDDTVSDRRQRERELEMYRRSMLDLKKEQIEKPASTKLSYPERTAAIKLDDAMNQAKTSMENLSQLTQKGQIYTSAGAYNNLSDTGVFGASAKAMGQSLTDEQKQMYVSIMYPLARDEAVARTAGFGKVNESEIKHNIEAFVNQQNQTHMTMLEKMAELKQKFILGAQSGLRAKYLNDEQRDAIRKNMDGIDKAIPWDVSDVIEFYRKGGKAENFGKFLDKKYKSETDNAGWKDM